MAKVTAPLLSMGASGTVGKTMTFGSWKGIPYIRQRVTPANPNSSGQQQTRTVFAGASQTWRLFNDDAKAPWNAFATGAQFTGRNAYVGRFTKLLRGETDLSQWLTSPGARSGQTVQTFGVSTGAASGEIDLTYTVPPTPDGWTLDGLRLVYTPDQDPSDEFASEIGVEDDTAASGTYTLTGLDAATAYAVSGFLVWTRDDGRKAYGVSVVDIASSGA